MIMILTEPVTEGPATDDARTPTASECAGANTKARAAKARFRLHPQEHAYMMLYQAAVTQAQDRQVCGHDASFVSLMLFCESSGNCPAQHGVLGINRLPKWPVRFGLAAYTLLRSFLLQAKTSAMLKRRATAGVARPKAGSMTVVTGVEDQDQGIHHDVCVCEGKIHDGGWERIRGAASAQDPNVQKKLIRDDAVESQQSRRCWMRTQASADE
ncbi:hypothetical protein C8R44DRAFT_749153 [Mycena epipterygia]|nr:hypothetical protein C8R44DRAFT_749153 [Mycena epipterygia]